MTPEEYLNNAYDINDYDQEVVLKEDCIKYGRLVAKEIKKDIFGYITKLLTLLRPHISHKNLLKLNKDWERIWKKYLRDDEN